MPSIDPPASRPIRFAEITSMPISGTVEDGDMVLRVRNVGTELQVAVEVYTQDRENAATISLPTLTPNAALALAKLLVETVTGQPIPEASAKQGEAPAG